MSVMIIKNLTKSQAEALQEDIHLQNMKNKGFRGDPRTLVTKQSGRIAEDPDNRGKWAYMDMFDLRPSVARVANMLAHTDTPAALKTTMAAAEDYTEPMADKFEPIVHRRPDPADENEEIQILLTREEKRLVAMRMDLRRLTEAEAVDEVMAER